MLSWDLLAQKLELPLHAGRIEHCIERVEEEMSHLPRGVFHEASEARFTNALTQVAAVLDDFAGGLEFEANAFYVECSSFEDEAQEWKLWIYAYDKCGDHEDYEWLEDYRESVEVADFRLCGMEKLQQLFLEGAQNSEENREAADFASLMALLKFQHLIQQALFLSTKIAVPLLATCSDYDLIYCKGEI